MSDDDRRVVFAVIKFLRDQLRTKTEASEDLVDAMNCLQRAYGLTMNDIELDIPVSLQELVLFALNKSQNRFEEAVKFNKIGDDYMQNRKYPEAYSCYTKAIILNKNNPVYYNNRAAVSQLLNNAESAVMDCKRSLIIDPKYCDAYVRLGKIYSDLDQYEQAAENYERATELEPQNDLYKENFQQALGEAQKRGMMEFDMTEVDLNDLALQLLANPSFKDVAKGFLEKTKDNSDVWQQIKGVFNKKSD
uniref:Uncharacterized protein n=1 Tax=Clastoptera arizonana TaxID=38151 RepID=A0A1B6D3K1_9HEMI